MQEVFRETDKLGCGANSVFFNAPKMIGALSALAKVLKKGHSSSSGESRWTAVASTTHQRSSYQHISHTSDSHSSSLQQHWKNWTRFWEGVRSTKCLWDSTQMRSKQATQMASEWDMRSAQRYDGKRRGKSDLLRELHGQRTGWKRKTLGPQQQHHKKKCTQEENGTSTR